MNSVFLSYWSTSLKNKHVKTSVKSSHTSKTITELQRRFLRKDAPLWWSLATNV